MDGRSGRGKVAALRTVMPRRRVLPGLGAIVATLAWRPRASHAQNETAVAVPCVPCEGGCCLRGLTGGGVVQFPDGSAQIVVFATRLEEGASQQGAGFVRWIESDGAAGRLTLESIGPITYGPVSKVPEARDIRGIMQVNGQGEYAFQLRVTDFGPERIGQDLAALSVGPDADGATPSSSFRYQAAETLVGGDFQLLDSVAPVAAQ